jgi:hypothetical protein
MSNDMVDIATAATKADVHRALAELRLDLLKWKVVQTMVIITALGGLIILLHFGTKP